MRRAMRIVLTRTEHPAVLATCEHLEALGEARLDWLSVDQEACVDLDELEGICRSGVDLVVLMAANNEVGTVYPIKEAASIAHRFGALLFSDATQAAGKIAIQADEWGIDLLTLSGHKIYGPKGVGALVLGSGMQIDMVVTGGSHQRGLRPGTLNVPGIAGLGEACRLRSREMEEDEARHGRLRDELQMDLCARVPSLVVNGPRGSRLAGTLHVSFPGVPSRAMTARLGDRLAVSTGSACSSGIEAPSHVLRGMGLDEALLTGAMRISLGKFTTEGEVKAAAELLSDTAKAVGRRVTA